MEKIVGPVFGFAYMLGGPLTYFYLMWVDWHQTHGVLAWVVTLAVNAFLAMIWPIYWAILHWIF